MAVGVRKKELLDIGDTGAKADMKLFKHKSYDHYRKAQISTNRAKATKIWVKPGELEQIAKVVSERTVPHFGICHGVRTGSENTTLSKLLGVEVLGTDIVGKPGVVKMDFHDDAPQWKGKASFIYTNSLDHSYDPNLALDRWIKCLRPDGIIMVHWGPGHGAAQVDIADCFGASAEEYRVMLSSYGGLEEKVILRHRPLAGEIVEIILFILTPTPQKMI